MYKSFLLYWFLVFSILIVPSLSHAVTISTGICSAKGSYSDVNYDDYRGTVKIGGLTFNNIRRSENKVSGSVDNGQTIWSFTLTNKTKLKLNARVSPRSSYDYLSGRTNWGYNCTFASNTTSNNNSTSGTNSSVNTIIHKSNHAICQKATYNGNWEKRERYKKYVQEAKQRGLSCGVEDSSTSTAANSKYARPDVVQEIVLTSPTSDVWINNDTGEAMMKSGSKWFYRIIDDIKDGQSIQIGILSFDKIPNTDTISNDEFNTFSVDAAVTVNGGVEALKANIKDVLKYLPSTRWYVLHMKSEDGSTAKFRLKVKD